MTDEEAYNLHEEELGYHPPKHDPSLPPNERPVRPPYPEVLMVQTFAMLEGPVRYKKRGSHVEKKVDISLLEALTGTSRTVRYSRARNCEACQGVGAPPEGRVAICPSCDGRGTVSGMRVGSYLDRVECPQCQGRGLLFEERCPKCFGAGIDHVHESVTVEIPPGIKDGDHLTLRCLGDDGKNGGQRGDLRVMVRIKKHEYMHRRGDNLYTEAHISVWLAMLGGELQVPTLEGTIVPLELPAGIQGGKVYRIRGEGMPRRKEPAKRGDLLVRVVVDTPTDLDSRRLAVVRQLAGEMGLKRNTFARPKSHFQ